MAWRCNHNWKLLHEHVVPSTIEVQRRVAPSGKRTRFYADEYVLRYIT